MNLGFHDLCRALFRREQTAFQRWRSLRTPVSFDYLENLSVRPMPVTRMFVLDIMQSAEISLLLLLQLGVGGAL